MPEITIRLGDRPHAIAAGTTLAGLLAALGHAQDAVATGLNGDFVRRDLRATTVLAEGDQVVLVKPIVGG